MPTPLGRLACQQNPLLFELETTVVSCEPCEGLFKVVLEDTVCFPTGGGQPNDTGFIASTHTSDDEKKVQILDAQRVAGHAVHFVDSPLQPGQKVRVSIDTERRTDHMQQHSAQHLLSAIAFKEFGWDTVGWNLSGSGRCSVEFSAPAGIAPPDATLLDKLERLANAAIRMGTAVVVEEAVTDTSLFRSREGSAEPTPSDDPDKGLLRFIRIAGYDINACCGTHVPNLGMLQLLKILGMENSARSATKSKKGKAEKTEDENLKPINARVFFVAGNRALEHYTTLVTVSKDLSGLTGGTTEDKLVSAIQRQLELLKATQKELSRLRMDSISISVGKIKDLLSSPSEKPRMLTYLPPHDANPLAANMAGELLVAFSNSLRPLVALTSPALILLSSLPDAAATVDVPLILSGTKPEIEGFAEFLVSEAGDKVKGNIVPGKDGWTRWQGKWISPVKRKEVDAWLAKWTAQVGGDITRIG